MQAIDIIDEAASRLRMRIESTPILIKNIENEISMLRKKESTAEYVKLNNANNSSNKTFQPNQNQEIKIEKNDVENSPSPSPFISSTLVSNIEAALFSTSSSTSNTTSSPTFISSAEITESAKSDLEPNLESAEYVAPVSTEMGEFLSKRNELTTDWNGIRTKLSNINKIRHFIETLKITLKSAIKAGNYSKVESIERFEIPNKEKEMANIFSSIPTSSPFYYLCDTVTAGEVANILAKNTGIPMGNLLEGTYYHYLLVGKLLCFIDPSNLSYYCVQKECVLLFTIKLFYLSREEHTKRMKFVNYV